MSRVFTIAKRELDSYFTTPIGWVSLCLWLLMTGGFFSLLLIVFNQASLQSMGGYDQGLNINEEFIPGFFSNCSVILLFLCPALSMRTFSEDMKQRSFELLLASPVSSLEIVLGKYFGALGFLLIMFAGTLHFPLILHWLSTPDVGVLTASYLTLFLSGAAYLALGMFVSSLTTNQLVAFVVSFGALLLCWIVSWAEGAGGSSDALTALLYTSILTHTADLAKGLVHIKDLVYFFTFIGFFLFATQQQVESHRWR